MTRGRAGRPGVASLALGSIVLITAAWWALALWPAGAVEPEWLVRTRAACFGSTPGGLPDAGGWILLVGQPAGMLGVLFVVWGRTVREDLRRTWASRRWRLLLVTLGALVVVGLGALGRRVAAATGVGATVGVPAQGGATVVDIDVSGLVLTDQHGQRTALSAFPGRSALLTFAYGHCVTVCPAIVHDVSAARGEAGRPDVPLIIVVLDPWRDTPERLPALAARWKLGPQDRVLSGSVDDVERTLSILGVARQRDSMTGEISHLASVMVIDTVGRVVRRLDGGWGGVGKLLALLPEPSPGVATR